MSSVIRLQNETTQLSVLQGYLKEICHLKDAAREKYASDREQADV